MDIAWHLRNGRLVVNDMWVVVDHPDVKIYELDLQSKYPGAAVISGDGHNTIDVILLTGDDTLNALNTNPQTDRDTSITFTGEGLGAWAAVVDGASYTITVILYQPNRE